MHPPKKILAVASTYWPILERIADKKMLLTAYEMRDLLAQYLPKEQITAANVLLQLEECGILEKSATSESEWEMIHAFSEFFRHISNRQKLSSPGILKSIIEDLSYLSNELKSMIEEKKTDMVISRCNEIKERMDNIRQISETRHAAVINETMKIKAQTDSRTVRQRYAFISELYEHHIEPLMAIIDTGGLLNIKLNELLYIIKAGLAAYENNPHVPEILHRIKSNIIRLENETLAHFQSAFKEVLPLYRQSRHDIRLAQAVTRHLDALSRDNTGKLANLINEKIPIAQWKSEDLFSTWAMEGYLFSISEYVATKPEPITLKSSPKSARNRYVDPYTLNEAMEEAMPIKDLLVWLFDTYPENSEDEILLMYHGIMQNHPKAPFGKDPSVLLARSVNYHYHPMRIEN